MLTLYRLFNYYDKAQIYRNSISKMIILPSDLKTSNLIFFKLLPIGDTEGSKVKTKFPLMI